ncbi:MAG: ThiF family adenylyltransferase, partial [Clostridia bacterium]|nr:ThiF family adenylyltransferase [Clostridia bacterium]
KIKQANILLIGVGGVGGAVAHMLVRAGITNLTIMDFDTVSQSNINRQFVAFQSTIGKYKVDVLASQLKDINPDINLTALNQKFDSTNNIDLTGYTMIIDCIDDIKAKQHLISKCSELNLLCSMGAGNRYADNPHFEVVDIFKTQNDALAKLLRKYCKEQGIKHLKVCYTPSLAIKSSPVGSISYYPVAMACSIAHYVINTLIS